MKHAQHGPGRFAGDAGIAIGPILFIIAILGILAAAIAAGSGSFTAGTATEGNNTKASAMIQIGENIKVGMDRITMEGGIAVNNVVTNVSATNEILDLFSPSGGGIAPPSVSLANDPTNDVWEFPIAIVPGVGTATGSTLAMLSVPSAVCDAINEKANGMTVATNYNAGDIGDPTTQANLGDLTGNTAWPALFAGKLVGCIDDTNSAAGYYFYQIIAIQ